MKHNYLISFLFIILMGCLFLSPAFAQEGMVRGTVVNEEGNPLAGVKITFYDPATGVKFTIETDKKGKFLRRAIYPATYEVTLQLEGYQPVRDILRVEVGSDKKLDLIMTKAQPQVKGGEDFIQGAHFFQQRDYKKAIAAFQKVVEKYPDYPDAYCNLGLSYLRDGQVEQAIELLNKALELNPDLLEAYYGLGESYVTKGMLEEAMKAFTRALEIQPDNAKAYYNVGIIYFNYDKVDEAIETFQKSKELDPTFSPVYYQLGLSYLKKEELELSITHFEKFLQLVPDAPEAESIKSVVSELKEQLNKTKKEPPPPPGVSFFSG